MPNQNNHLVIMAGGIGSRFWPMSTPEYPKQFVDVLGQGRSLLQLTFDRFKGVCPSSNVWVVTSANYAGIVREQLPEVPVENILLEPCRRNTAPCIAYVSWRIKKLNPKANIVVSPSDHIVTDVKEFDRVVSSALSFVAESDAIVTLGMKPTRPETGYGYIQANLSLPSSRNKELFAVDCFREKPDLQTAREYVAQDNFYWNSGLFVWNISTIVNALRVYEPSIAAVFEGIFADLGTEREQAVIDREFSNCPNISIDYAVLEKAEDIFVFPASFGWSDLGTWGSLREISEKDADGNALIGPDIQAIECRNCIVHTVGEKRVVIQGLEDCIVAERDGVLLICKLSEEQRIKEWGK